MNYYPRGSKFYEKYRSGSELDHICFWVSNVDRTYKMLLRKGAKDAVNPFSVGKFRSAFARDPDGNWIELVGYIQRKKKRHSPD